MSQPPGRTFGKRPLPLKPAPKRSQGVRLKVMAGAGAAALGLYAVMPHRPCEDGRFYETLDACLSDGQRTGDDCRTAFSAVAKDTGFNTTPGGVLFQGTGGMVPITRQSDGRLVTQDGRLLGDAMSCRRGGGTHSTSSSSGSRRSWWSRSSSSSSSSYSAVSSDSGHAVSRGGFGGSGHGFFGGS